MQNILKDERPTLNVEPRLGVDEIGEFMLSDRSAPPVYKIGRIPYSKFDVGRSTFDVHLFFHFFQSLLSKNNLEFMGVGLDKRGRFAKVSSGSLRCSDGFTLIETLVAMAILSISLVVILQLFSGGLKSSRLSDNYTRAIFHAREKMEEILLEDNFADMTMEGEFSDGFEWKAQTLRLEPAQEEEETKLPVDIFSIKVNVGWHEGRQEKHFEISTLKTAEKAES